jgi:DNA (cytosine-5)-methyltransferase 1
MRHLDLFTGIGGFAYAAQQVWGKDYEPIAFCEIDKFCQRVLKKHWPDVEIVNDIKEIGQFEDIDLITAGVPCQPASVAGKKRGTADERWLWPETLRIIGDIRPKYALLENVPGLFSLEQGLAFNGILSGLAEIGYDCWWETISASAVGAPHIRERIWVVAYSNSILLQRVKSENMADVSLSEKTPIKISSFANVRQSNRLGNYRGIRKSNGIPNRVDRLKALGNAIVPQVAMVIMEAIKETEKYLNKQGS